MPIRLAPFPMAASRFVCRGLSIGEDGVKQEAARLLDSVRRAAPIAASIAAGRSILPAVPFLPVARQAFSKTSLPLP